VRRFKWQQSNSGSYSLCQDLGQCRRAKKVSEQWNSERRKGKATTSSLPSPHAVFATFLNPLSPLSWRLEQAISLMALLIHIEFLGQNLEFSCPALTFYLAWGSTTNIQRDSEDLSLLLIYAILTTAYRYKAIFERRIMAFSDPNSLKNIFTYIQATFVPLISLQNIRKRLLLCKSYRAPRQSIYPAGRGFSFAWFSAFTKSFAWLVCYVVGFAATRTTS